jgi:DNA replicative helicase MCM subunit Mcm2 (Cdc46/Mcm family)
MAERFAASIHTEYLSLFRERLESDVDALDWLWQHVNPNMSQRRRERTAALLACASEHDRHGVRGRVHTLLVGAPGTGKTALKDWIKRTMPDAVGIGPDSSNAGLRLNANTGAPGALARAHEGTLCIEELDNFGKAERNSLYEAMSEGYFEVDKGDFSTAIDAETRVVAVANAADTFGEALLSRFDFIIEVEQYGSEQTITVSTDLYDRFRDAYVLDNPDEQPPLVPQYLAYIADERPGYPEDEHDRVVGMLERLVREAEVDGRIREKEAYLRVAYVVAKLNCRDITAYDWVRAVDLIHPAMDTAALFGDVLDDTDGTTR